MSSLNNLIANRLRELADKFEANTSEATEQQCLDILHIIGHERMSKEQACTYMNLSRSRFDDLVREKKIPKGQKRTGFKELIWYRDELDMSKKWI